MGSSWLTANTVCAMAHSMLFIKKFNQLQNYAATLAMMQAFTAQRQNHRASTVDEIWLMQHPPVYTLGLASKPAHLLNTGNIPVVQSDRGGQVTYHGVGQLVVYLLLDLPRLGLGVKALVSLLEQSVLEVLAHHAITGQRRAGAAGVYVDGAKIASLGLRVRHGCSYHGLSLNIDMDLTPFLGINPCGYAGLAMTQMADFIQPDFARIEQQLISALQHTIFA